MKFPIKQVGYCLSGVPHLHSLVDCIKWWILRKNKHCKSFCLTCKWWFRCQEDVEYERILNSDSYNMAKYGDCKDCEFINECKERMGF